MIDYYIENFKNVKNFDERTWNNELLGFYRPNMQNYVPYDTGATYDSETYLIGDTLDIYYHTSYSEDIYNGMYFGEQRDPLTKKHSQATNKWIEVFTDENEMLLNMVWNMWIREFE